MTTAATGSRPIIFSGPMVRAILAEKKTQTRRIANLMPKGWQGMTPEEYLDRCPYGRPGDTLWVREGIYYGADSNNFYYGADEHGCGTEIYRKMQAAYKKGCAARFMPRWASRLALEITGVRFELVQDISRDDVRAEGIPETWGDASDLIGYSLKPHEWDNRTAQEQFAWTWDRINGKRPDGAWKDNPWVWVIEFTPDGEGI